MPRWQNNSPMADRGGTRRRRTQPRWRGITRRWSGPRRWYNSPEVERRVCAAAAAQRHYVIPHSGNRSKQDPSASGAAAIHL
jgi:hypothetical protein